jgi:hypothetical protein
MNGQFCTKSTGVSEKSAGLNFTKHEINIKPVERSVFFRMLRRVGWLLATDVSGQAIGSIFKYQACQAVQAAVSSEVAVPVHTVSHAACKPPKMHNVSDTLHVPYR